MSIENHYQTQKKLSDVDLRAEQIIHLASQCSLEILPHEVEEAFDSDWDEIWEALGLAEPSDDLQSNLCQLSEEEKLGFLVKMAMPMFNSGDTFYDWQHCMNRWFYAESLGDVYSAALEWYQEQFEANAA